MIETGEQNLFKELNTQRLTLRQILPSDAKELYENIYNNFDWYKFCYTVRYRDFDDFKYSLRSDEIKYKVGNYFRWGVVEKETGKMIGEVRLHSKEYFTNRIKIGYLLSYNHQNLGYATEAVTRVINFCFNEMNISRIQAEIVQNNESSLQLVKRIGMSYEKTMRCSYKIGSKYYDQDVYYVVNPNDGQKVLTR